MELRRRAHGDQLVLAGAHGEHLRRTRTDGSSRGRFTQAVRRADLPPLTPHDLRQTAASLSFQAGAIVTAVHGTLGNASAAMTLDGHADLFDDDLDAVAERLNEGLTRTGVPRPKGSLQ
jgi:integrase